MKKNMFFLKIVQYENENSVIKCDRNVKDYLYGGKLYEIVSEF